MEDADFLVCSIAFCVEHSIRELFVSSCFMAGELEEESWQKMNQVNHDMEHHHKSLTLYLCDNEYMETKSIQYLFPKLKVKYVTANKFDAFFPEHVNPFFGHCL